MLNDGKVERHILARVIVLLYCYRGGGTVVAQMFFVDNW